MTAGLAIPTASKMPVSRDVYKRQVRQGGGECHRHSGAFHAGCHRGRHFAGGGGAGVQYLDPAVEAQANLGADGVKEVQVI